MVHYYQLFYWNIYISEHFLFTAYVLKRKVRNIVLEKHYYYVVSITVYFRDDGCQILK